MVYREDLPEGCPTDGARPQTRRLYRLIQLFPPDTTDFDSQWLQRPDKRDGWEDIECMAKGVSLFISPRVALQKAKGRNMYRTQVCEVNLTQESGPVMQTSSTHFTWWPLKDCNILALCSEVEL